MRGPRWKRLSRQRGGGSEWRMVTHPVESASSHTRRAVCAVQPIRNEKFNGVYAA